MREQLQSCSLQLCSNCSPPTYIIVSSFHAILHILQFHPQNSGNLTPTCTMSIEGKSSVNDRSLVTCMHGCVRKWLRKSTKGLVSFSALIQITIFPNQIF